MNGMMFNPSFAPFWQQFRQQRNSPINDLLNQENLELEELLDDQDFLLELKSQNEKLINYFDQDRLLELLQYIVKVPEDNGDTKRCYKLPFITGEVLSSDIQQIMKQFFESHELIETLFSFLKVEKDQELNPTLVGYFSKTVMCLLNRETDNTFNYIFLENPEVLNLLLAQVQTKAISEIVQRLLCFDNQRIIGSETGICPENAERYLESRKHIIKVLVEKLKGNVRESQNSSQILVYLIQHQNQISAGQQLVQDIENKLAATLVSQIFTEENQSESFKFGVQFLSALLNCDNSLSRINFIYEEESAESESALSQSIAQYIPYLALELKREPLPVTNQFRQTFIPLGPTRLKMIELLYAAIKKESKLINKQIKELKILKEVNEMLIRFEWNSMFQVQYENIIKAILDSQYIDLKEDLVRNCNLIEFIVSTAKENQQLDSRGRLYRRGYMGTLTRVSNLLLNSTCSVIRSFLRDSLQWQDYVEHILMNQNEIETKSLGDPINSCTGNLQNNLLDRKQIYISQQKEQEEEEEEEEEDQEIKDLDQKLQNFEYEDIKQKDNSFDDNDEILLEVQTKDQQLEEQTQEQSQESTQTQQKWGNSFNRYQLSEMLIKDEQESGAGQHATGNDQEQEMQDYYRNNYWKIPSCEINFSEDI